MYVNMMYIHQPVLATYIRDALVSKPDSSLGTCVTVGETTWHQLHERCNFRHRQVLWNTVNQGSMLDGDVDKGWVCVRKCLFEEVTFELRVEGKGPACRKSGSTCTLGEGIEEIKARAWERSWHNPCGCMKVGTAGVQGVGKSGRRKISEARRGQGPGKGICLLV